MTIRSVLQSQQSAPAGCWRVAPGSALSLRPREDGVLHVASGRVWVTLGTADHVLHAGERLAIAPGQHAVVEAWDAAGAQAAIRWHRAAPAPTARLAAGIARFARVLPVPRTPDPCTRR
ncbi:MAG: DUF2917 domain-containing protein [Acidovorax sp.]|uniref:DUF2917 domain-containing protein n=1 Tax=Acidovorax sp. TaxID=1872122 RepID=UPI0039E38B00